MIEILVEGHPLAISSDTQVCLEVENAVFDIDNVSAEIGWQFDVSARDNSAILNNADCVFFGNTKKYDCRVLFSGVPIGRGSLYVQQVNNGRSIRCGLTINEFSSQWRAKALVKNELGCMKIVGYDYKVDWREFLRHTLEEDSNVKFFPFIDEKFSESADFGFFRNQPSSLSNNRNDFTKYVNRLFTDEGGNIIECYDNAPQGLRIFNAESGMGHKINGYHFAPAFRLRWLLERVLGCDGFSLSGSFADNGFVNNIFLQSMNAMDGDGSQYDNACYLSLSGVAGVVPQTPRANAMRFEIGEEVHEAFTVGNGTLAMGLCVFLPERAMLKKNMTGWQYLDRYDEAYFLVVCAEGVDLSLSYCRIGNDKGRDYIGVFEKFGKQETVGANYLYYYYTAKRGDVAFVQLTDTSYREAVCMADGDFAKTVSKIVLDDEFLLDGGKQYQVVLVKARVATTYECFTIVSDAELYNGKIIDTRGGIEHISDMQVVASSGTDSVSGLNVFAKELDLKKYMPEGSNSDFVKTICKLFGLNMYIDSDSRMVQMNFFADELKAEALDVSAYVCNRKRLTYEPKRYEISLASALEGKEIAEENVINSVLTKDLLPPPRLHYGKHCFVKAENKFYHSSKDDDGRVKWLPSGGNNLKLSVGNAEEAEEIEIGVMIPNMRFVDSDRVEKYFQEIDLEGCSSLLQEDYSGRFDMVLTQYVGKKTVRLEKEGNHQFVTIERANPTFYAENGSVNERYINLAVEGRQSIGEMWLLPKYGFLASAEWFEFDLFVPVGVFWEIKNLVKPQSKPINEQVRWLMIDNQRFLPRKISAQMGSSDNVRVTIECARDCRVL